MKALVTGGAGFIGSNLSQLLCDEGHQVVVLDDLSSGHRQLVDQRAELVEGAIEDSKLLSEILPGIEVVFHLAATSTITYSLTNPRKYFENNFINGVILLEAMKKADVGKIVYSSSASSYGNSDERPLKENDLTEPINPYGASKYSFEHVLSSYHRCFGINSVSLRYFNVYGPNDEQKNNTRAVPKWVRAALQNKPLTLYWKGEQKRDYIFVRDIVLANLMAALNCNGFDVYNVGNGRGVWMKDIVKKLEEIVGRELTIEDAGERPGDPKFAMADISKIKEKLGWHPTIDLETGLKITVDYFKTRITENL